MRMRGSTLVLRLQYISTAFWHTDFVDPTIRSPLTTTTVATVAKKYSKSMLYEIP